MPAVPPVCPAGTVIFTVMSYRSGGNTSVPDEAIDGLVPHGQLMNDHMALPEYSLNNHVSAFDSAPMQHAALNGKSNADSSPESLASMPVDNNITTGGGAVGFPIGTGAYMPQPRGSLLPSNMMNEPRPVRLSASYYPVALGLTGEPTCSCVHTMCAGRHPSIIF